MQTIASPIVQSGPDDKDPAALMALYDRCVDSANGYAKMVEKAEPDFRDIAEQFRALHARHAAGVARLLADLGVTPDTGGTLMGTINQAVVAFRAFFDDIDEDVMDQVRRGEDWVLKAFDAAIVAQPEPGPAAELRAMKAELSGLLADTRQMG